MKMPAAVAALALSLVAFSACEDSAVVPDVQPEASAKVCPVIPKTAGISPESIARLLSELPFGLEQVREVHAAVKASARNGYDEEYPFGILIEAPGTGVGDAALNTKSSAIWPAPLSRLLSDYVSVSSLTRSDTFFEALKDSGLQIYWPYSEDWDGVTLPVITFNPENDSEKGTGFRRTVSTDGTMAVEEITVDEAFAMKNPVWVVNRNEDSGALTPELLSAAVSGSPVCRSSSGSIKTLAIKEFKAHRNYDSWFAGGSEFYIKCGSLEKLFAATTDQLKLYYPSVTDLMIVIKRKQVGKAYRFNAILVSEWTEQLESCAFLIIEDDGGTMTSWKCTADVKIKSRTYGVDMNIPYHRNDDIVWRGMLSNGYFEKYNGISSRLGDVSVTFRIY